MAGVTEMQLALAAHQRGDYAAAERIYRQRLKSAPGDFDALHMLGVLQAQQGRLPEGEKLVRRALQIRPTSVEARNNLGNLLLEMGRAGDAVAQLRQAIAQRPQEAELHVNLGNALRAAEQFDAAAASYEAALRLNPNYLAALHHLVDILCDLDRHREAQALLDRIGALAPNDPEFLALNGRVWQEIGDLEHARTLLGRAIDLRPDLPAAWYALSRVGAMAPERLSRLEALAARQPQPPAGKALLEFALAKVLDDLGRYDEAFEHLSAGNHIKRGLVSYSESVDVDRMQRLVHAFDAQLFADRSDHGSESELPIFIVGFPRSGTTLVEQILASHPDVYGAGERTFMSQIASAIHDPADERLRFPECLSRLPSGLLRHAGERYVEFLRGLGTGAKRVTDKYLFNYAFIGLIRLVLPRARILHVYRDPRDSCLSCFTLHFGNSAYFSYDLGELGRAYRRYFELMAHWRSVLPAESMLEINYEDVVGDLEGQARRIVDHCGLGWDDQCLDFHRTERSVTTASLAQVRQPIYRSSLARWRRYEKHLGPLFDALGSALTGWPGQQAH